MSLDARGARLLLMLRRAIIEHARSRAAVVEWSAAEAARGRLCRNGDAPGWPRYEQTRRAIDELTETIEQDAKRNGELHDVAGASTAAQGVTAGTAPALPGERPADRRPAEPRRPDVANVKRLEMRATVPFNYYEDQDLAARFAFIQSPSSGLRAEFGREEYQPNEHGGRTAFYPVTITGQEAVAYAWIEALAASIRRLGGTCGFCADDIEQGEPLARRPKLETFRTYDAQGREIRVTVPENER